MSLMIGDNVIVHVDEALVFNEAAPVTVAVRAISSVAPCGTATPPMLYVSIVALKDPASVIDEVNVTVAEALLLQSVVAAPELVESMGLKDVGEVDEVVAFCEAVDS